MTTNTNPLAQLNDLAIRRFELEALIVSSIEDAIAVGATWSTVADMLGVSKQAAHKRYAHLVRPEFRQQGQVARQSVEWATLPA